MEQLYSGLASGLQPAAALAKAQSYLMNLPGDALSSAPRRLETLLKGGPRAALRRALSRRSGRLMKPLSPDAMPTDYSHPYFWAPFQVLGSR